MIGWTTVYIVSALVRWSRGLQHARGDVHSICSSDGHVISTRILIDVVRCATCVTAIEHAHEIYATTKSVDNRKYLYNQLNVPKH